MHNEATFTDGLHKINDFTIHYVILRMKSTCVYNEENQTSTTPWSYHLNLNIQMLQAALS